MKTTSLMRLLFIVITMIIIIGGIIIVIIRGPIPEPVCPACVARRIVPWCIAEIFLGMASLVLINKIFYAQKPVRRYRSYYR